MRALSLTQPWAFLVVHGGKNIENRSWSTKRREPFLIHAAKGMRQSDYDDAMEMAIGVNLIAASQVPPFGELERGGIIGMATIVDVIPKTTWPHIPWHMFDRYGFVLEDIKPLPFYPCKGALNFWGNFDVVDGKVVQL